MVRSLLTWISHWLLSLKGTHLPGKQVWDIASTVWEQPTHGLWESMCVTQESTSCCGSNNSQLTLSCRSLTFHGSWPDSSTNKWISSRGFGCASCCELWDASRGQLQVQLPGRKASLLRGEHCGLLGPKRMASAGSGSFFSVRFWILAPPCGLHVCGLPILVFVGAPILTTRRLGGRFADPRREQNGVPTTCSLNLVGTPPYSED